MNKARIIPEVTDEEEARIQAGIAEDPDNPEWTAEDFAKAKPFREVFPELAERMAREGAETESSATERSVTVERRIVERFKEQGADWEKRINDVLRKAAGL